VSATRIPQVIRGGDGAPPSSDIRHKSRPETPILRCISTSPEQLQTKVLGTPPNEQL
jgi:hypothetical protein